MFKTVVSGRAAETHIMILMSVVFYVTEFAACSFSEIFVMEAAHFFVVSAVKSVSAEMVLAVCMIGVGRAVAVMSVISFSVTCAACKQCD